MFSKQTVVRYFWLTLCCTIAFCCPKAQAASVTEATQISAVYNPNGPFQSVYFADLNGI